MAISCIVLEPHVVNSWPLCYKGEEALCVHGVEPGSLPMDLTDEELVALAQAGDRKAFEELVVRHQQRAYSLALHMCLGDVQEAQDLTQEAFLRAFRNIGSFRGDSTFYTWLFRIVVNTCLDGRRKRSRWENLFSFWRSRSEENEESDELETQPDQRPGADPLANLSGRELSKEVRKALAQLPPRQRMALQLKVIHGMNLKEIADIMGAAEGTVKSHLFRATHRLQRTLKDWI